MKKHLAEYFHNNSTTNLLIIAASTLILITIPVTVYLVQQAEQVTKNPQAAITVTNTIDQLVNTRPDHANPHAVHLPLPMYDWSWGVHGTEDNKSHGSGSVNLWLAMLYDQSNVGHVPNVKINIRRMYGYALTNGVWTKIYDGLPTWYVSTPDTGGGYVDIAPTTESDGSYSFQVPMNLMLHMSTPAPGLQLPNGANGIVSVVEARLLGTATDITASKLALSAGADYRDSSGSGGSITQSGFGQGGLLTADWQAYDMISTTLTDTQIRANPPPGFTSGTVDNPPTVSITSPASGATITAGTTVAVAATATDTDTTPVANVKFSIDGALVATDTASPYTYNWNTIGLTGSHTITAIAYDTANQASTPSTVIVTIRTTAKIGDVNGDGRVNILDVSQILDKWGATNKPPEDINQDGRVDIQDIAIVISHWG